jgi:hypothetical protein
MTKETSDFIGTTANLAGILTAFIATIFYYKSQEKSYYLNDISGNYKIFSKLKNQEATALYHFKISYVSPKGWFFGVLKYSESTNIPNSGSGGSANVVGKLNYSFLRIIFSSVIRNIKFKSYNPLEVNNLSSFHGKLYLLSRNDLDISERNWKDMLVQEYSIVHYRDAQRIKLYKTIVHQSYLQIPNELVLVNTDKIPDPYV